MPTVRYKSGGGASFPARQSIQDIEALKLVCSELSPVVIVELGTDRCGSTSVLRDAAPESEIFSFDMKAPRLTEEQVASLGSNTHIVDADVLKSKDVVCRSFQAVDGVVLLFCDNGNKPLEVELYAPTLRTGDVIGVHDWETEVCGDDVDHILCEPDWVPYLSGHTEKPGCACRFWVRA